MRMAQTIFANGNTERLIKQCFPRKFRPGLRFENKVGVHNVGYACARQVHSHRRVFGKAVKAADDLPFFPVADRVAHRVSGQYAHRKCCFSHLT